MSHLMNTYERQPVAFVRGEGSHVFDEAGRRYLDALAGIAVNTLGHGPPVLTRALAEQARRQISSVSYPNTFADIGKDATVHPTPASRLDKHNYLVFH